MPRNRHDSETDVPSKEKRSQNELIGELQAQIEDLLARLNKQGAMIQALGDAQPNHGNATCIDRAADASPQIPELIKLTPTFDGTPSALASFIDSVEQKLTVSEAGYSEQELATLMPIWVGLIRDKIIGRANEILIENQTPLVWANIKATLKENLGDKREIATLLASVNRLRQGAGSLDEYYRRSRALLTSLNSNTVFNNPDSKTIRETYEMLLINAFIDGLHEELIDFVSLSKPETLLDAFRAAQQKQQALNRRKGNARNKFANQQNSNPAGSSNAKKHYFKINRLSPPMRRRTTAKAKMMPPMMRQIFNRCRISTTSLSRRGQ